MLNLAPSRPSDHHFLRSLTLASRSGSFLARYVTFHSLKTLVRQAQWIVLSFWFSSPHLSSAVRPSLVLRPPFLRSLRVLLLPSAVLSLSPQDSSTCLRDGVPSLKSLHFAISADPRSARISQIAWPPESRATSRPCVALAPIQFGCACRGSRNCP